jgi:hypothetical protein
MAAASAAAGFEGPPVVDGAGRLSTKTWPGPGHVFVREMQDEAFTWLDDRLS